jgi:hypothetical protein
MICQRSSPAGRGGQFFSDIPPRPGRGRSSLSYRPTGRTSGAVGRDSRGAFSSSPRGTVAGRSRPAPYPPWAVDRWADGAGTNGDLSCTASPVLGSTTPAVPSPSALLAACTRCGGCCGPFLPLSLSLREDGRGFGCEPPKLFWPR